MWNRDQVTVDNIPGETVQTLTHFARGSLRMQIFPPRKKQRQVTHIRRTGGVQHSGLLKSIPQTQRVISYSFIQLFLSKRAILWITLTYTLWNIADAKKK